MMSVVLQYVLPFVATTAVVHLSPLIFKDFAIFVSPLRKMLVESL
jgi:hypothetical protein